jgi:hypothetical protein
MNVTQVQTVSSTAEGNPDDQINNLRLPAELFCHISFKCGRRLLISNGRAVLAGDGFARKIELSLASR